MATKLDALVVGAGFGGIYESYRLRELGLSFKVIDKASDVGGTWYWNKYPGAMSDSESFVYRFSWDKEDLRTYPWTHHYLRRGEILKYLEHVVEKHDLRKHMQFHTEMLSATWVSDKELWRVTTSTDETIEARYLITALGLLSTPNYPKITGLSTFKGDLCHTSAWREDIKLDGRRVGLIGCGSTGIQVVTEISSKVGSLTCFQRHPQYSVPSGNRPVDPEYRKSLNENYDEILANLRKSKTAFGVAESKASYDSVTPDEATKVFQKLWDQGNGFRFMFGGFSDIATNRAANQAACEFIRSKIAEVVRDPEKARKLTPKDSYARRPLCDGGYYQQFNRPNVDIVNLQDTPIESITATGITTTDGNHFELDVLIIATGFDAVEGSYNRLSIRGASGQTLAEKWSQGPTSYMGCLVSGFPNLFMVTGPQGPFTNLPPAIEVHVEFNTTLIKKVEEVRAVKGRAIIEAQAEAEEAWVDQCNKLSEGTIYLDIPSWIFASKPGSAKLIPRFYFGGMDRFVELIADVLETHRGLKSL